MCHMHVGPLATYTCTQSRSVFCVPVCIRDQGFTGIALIPVQAHRFLLLSPFVYLPPCPTPFHTGTWTPVPGTVPPMDPAHLLWLRLPSRAPVCVDQSPLSSAPGSPQQASLEWEGQTL